MTTAPPSAPRLRPRWQDALTEVSDLALLGIVTALAALPVVTLGAAVGAASRAVGDRCANGSHPAGRTTLKRFVRGIVPGAGATAVTLAVAALLVIDVRAVALGLVPGGPPVIVATGLVVLLAAGFGGLVVVAYGRGAGWRAAVRQAGTQAWRRPGALVAAAAITGLAALLAVAVPVTSPIVLGCWLYALHVTVARLAS